jgi:hypothetical protein
VIRFVDGVIPFVDGVIPLVDGVIPFVDGVISFVDGVIPFVDSVIPFVDDVIPFVDGVISVAGIHLQICPRGVTCCTPEMETKLWTFSRKTYTESLAATTHHTQALFHSRSKRFDGKQVFTSKGTKS